MVKNPSTSLRTKGKRWTRRRLLALGVPAVLIPGLLIAMALGWNPTKLGGVKDYHQIKTIFPTSGVVASVTDGDTFELQNGVGVRLIGIDAPNRGEGKWEEAGGTRGKSRRVQKGKACKRGNGEEGVGFVRAV